MAGYRLTRLLIHVFAAVLTGITLYPFLGLDRRRRYIQRWSVKLLAICGIEVRVTGANALASRALIVANHHSWIDIYLINSLSPCRFIAKAEIGNWPVIGWLGRKSGTIFIERGRQRDLKRILKNLAVPLHSGERFAFFPEGTTSMQGNLLPFHPNLFEAAIGAGIAIQPFAIRYLDTSGSHHAAIDFSGETTFLQSVFSVLRTTEIKAELIVLPPLKTVGMHRRDLARMSRETVSKALSRESGNPGIQPEKQPDPQVELP